MDKNELWNKLSVDSQQKVKELCQESRLNEEYDIKAMFYDLYSRGAQQCKGVENIEDYMEVISPDKYVKRTYEMYQLGEVKLKDNKEE